MPDMRRLIVLVLLPLFAPFAALADEPGAARVAAATTAPSIGYIRPGEVIELRMSYGLLGTAGTTRIETTAEPSTSGPHYRIHVTTQSRGLVDTFYPVANDSASVIDATTGRPLSLTTKGKNGRRLTEKTTTFDYEKLQAVHVNAIRPQHNATVTLPAEPAYDLMVAMLQTRDWRLQPGQSRRVQCVNDEEFFTIEITALAEEKVKTPLGTFDAVVLEPKPVGKSTSFFAKGGSLKIWVTKGARPQIARLDTRTKFGTITALLTKDETVAAVLPPPAPAPTP